jgi:hypothetical protein
MKNLLFLFGLTVAGVAQEPKTLIIPYVNPAKGMPTSIDAKTKGILQKSLDAYSKLTSVEVVVRGDDVVRVRRQGKAMSESRAGYSWVFDGSTLSIKNGTGTSSMPAKQRQVPELLLPKDIYLDPLTRCFAYQLNPIKELIVKKQKATLNGVVQIGGQRCYVVHLSDGDRLLSLAIRPDGLLASVGSRVGPIGGQIRSERRFSYVSINKPLAKSSFRLGG